LAAINEAKCKNPNEPINLIGHSWGGDTAADVAEALGADGNTADLLVTVDPVSGRKGDFTEVADGSSTWINIDAENPWPPNRSDFVADAGGPWNDKPRNMPMSLEQQTCITISSKI
jgi:thioesterase domain-containing protein